MNRKLLERTIANLKTTLDCDRDVMEAADVEQLMNDIDTFEKMLPSETSELIGCYCQPEDKTFVMKNTYIGGELHTAECVGWYCGEPTDEDNKRYANGDLLAVYDWDN